MIPSWCGGNTWLLSLGSLRAKALEFIHPPAPVPVASKNATLPGPLSWDIL
jgi:hypothetical protein